MIAKFVLPFALLAAPLAAQTPSRVLTGADLFNLEQASDPQISPDGRQVAYVRRANDVMTDRARSTIWLVDVASKRQAPLVAGAGDHFGPRWSPDETRLAYVSTAEGKGAQLYVRWLGGGEAARITNLPDSPGAIAWSPDGKRIAYVVRVPGEAARLGQAPRKPEGANWAPPLEVITDLSYRSDEGGYRRPGRDQLFVVPAEGGAPRQLTFTDADVEGPISWTTDGRRILIGGNQRPNAVREPDSEVYAVDADTGAIAALTDRKGPDGSAVMSSDGSRIAWLGYDDKVVGYQNSELWVMNRDGSGRRSLTASLDRGVDQVVWSGNSLVIRYDDRGTTKLARVSLDGRVSELASGLVGGALDRPYTGGSFSVSLSGVAAYTCGTVHRPADVCVTGRGGQLTRLNDWLEAKQLGEVRKLDVRAPDGRSIDSWLVMPPGAQPGRRYPLILEIHGGPHAAYASAFSTDNQLYAAAGYAVLYTNPRGSTSYGEAFAQAIQNKYPGDDYGDLIAAVDAAIASGAVDPEQLFITGGSGGGVLTAWTIGKTNRFKAAAVQKPVIDWSSFALTADQPSYFARYWFGKLPWEDPETYWRRSPLSLVGSVKTPALVVVGSEDYRTPVSEAEQYYTALQLRGVDTALVKVPGASHGGLTARPSQSAAKAAAILAWFDRYRAPTR